MRQAITASELLAKQNAIHSHIDSVARANGLTIANMDPIYDGV